VANLCHVLDQLHLFEVVIVSPLTHCLQVCLIPDTEALRP
jgi:hypothetical protein